MLITKFSVNAVNIAVNSYYFEYHIANILEILSNQYNLPSW